MTLERRDLLDLLPEVMRLGDLPGSPFAATVDGMQTLLAPTVRHVDEVHRWFDPFTAPPDALHLLASWLDLGVAADTALACHDDAEDRDRALRRLVLEGHDLVRARGTRAGLLRLLEVVTGVEGFAIADANATPPFHLVVSVPPAVQQHAPGLARLIDHERPVYVTWSLHHPPTIEP